MFALKGFFASVRSLACGLALCSPAAASDPGSTPRPSLSSRSTPQGTELRLGSAPAFHVTRAEIRQLRRIGVPESPSVVVLWSELSGGVESELYAISRDGGHVDVVRRADYRILTRRGHFDPLVDAPRFDGSSLPAGGDVYIVQFVTQPIEAYRARLRSHGARIGRYLTHNSYLVRMSPAVRAVVEADDFVRWIGPYHPEFRLEERLLIGVSTGSVDWDGDYYVQVFETGVSEKQAVADFIRARGGTIESLEPGGYLLRASMSAELLGEVAARDEVVWIDRIGDPVGSMDIARTLGGANFIEKQLGFTGAGVRGEVLDLGARPTHQEFQDPPAIQHTPVPPDAHGTSTTSIVFATGIDPIARGMLPDGQAILADVFNMISQQHQHYQELVDPTLPYRAVLQSNSWGLIPLGKTYTNRTMEVDQLIFDTDLLAVWGQGNSGDQVSLQEAWAKNVLTVGGFRHMDTWTISDDTWDFTGSIGPAEDGRIKPDMTAFYDHIYAATEGSDSAYNPMFGGTSGATPITAGHAGVFFQMWHERVFANFAPGATVFDNRPHSPTARAAVIHTATPYEFSGQNHDFARTHQGWGRANLRRLYARRDNILIVDETDVLQNLDSTSYGVTVTDARIGLRATLCYLDVPGTTASTQHRINDLTLKLTSPGGAVYWGNHGLLDGNSSIAGGSANTLDTVENVFVDDPELGAWTIEVIASEINADSHVETPAVDADYALIVSGFQCPEAVVYCTAKTSLVCGTPTIGSSGVPSATATSGYSIRAGPALGQSAGLLIYTNKGRDAFPFEGGYLCLAAPLRRSVAVQSGGTPGTCDGVFSLDRNAFAQGLLGGHPDAFLRVPGTVVDSQWWGRDSQATGSFLSDALEDTVCN